MRALKKSQLPHLSLLTILSFFSTTSAASEDALTRTCGQIPIQQPFSIQTSNLSSPLSHMLLCKSQNLYFRTSLGLFPISSVNYATKVFTISHPSCSHSTDFVSPKLLSAGFPTPSKSNSLLLFNCSNSKNNLSPFIKNYTCSQECGASSFNCLLVGNIEKLDMGFHPNDLNCSHYSRVCRKSSDDDNSKFEGFELGTRISFDIPDHVPNACNECEKPNGNCGVGLRCICHAKDCKDKVISQGESINGVGNILVSLVSSMVVIVSLVIF